MLARINESYFKKTKQKVNVSLMCSTFHISRQAYYKQLQSMRKAHKQRQVIVNDVLQQRKIMPRLGTLKLYYLLKPQWQENNIKCGRDKLFNILRDERMLVKKKKNFTKTTNSMHRFKKHPNLIENIKITHSEQVWVSDITYIRAKGGFLYLSLVTDAFSKQIMGYNLADNLKTESSIKALKMALKNRRYPDRELIHHSDRGLQYCSPAYTKVLEDKHIKVSMTNKYDPYENAIAERVNGILKSEFDIDETFTTFKESKKVISNAIDVYNQLRPHLTCNYRTPLQAHKEDTFEPIKWKSKKLTMKNKKLRTT